MIGYLAWFSKNRQTCCAATLKSLYNLCCVWDNVIEISQLTSSNVISRSKLWCKNNRELRWNNFPFQGLYLVNNVRGNNIKILIITQFWFPFEFLMTCTFFSKTKNQKISKLSKRWIIILTSCNHRSDNAIPLCNRGKIISKKASENSNNNNCNDSLQIMKW